MTRPCPDCSLVMEPRENPPAVELTLTDRNASWRFLVSRESIVTSRGDSIAKATLKLRQEQRKAGSCRCDGTGLVGA